MISDLSFPSCSKFIYFVTSAVNIILCQLFLQVSYPAILFSRAVFSLCDSISFCDDV